MEEVDWAHRATYIRDHHSIDPDHASEAVNDPAAAWFEPDPASRSGRTARVIGYSTVANEVLTVIVLPKDSPGQWWGSNAWVSNRRDRRIYERGE